MIVYAKVQRLLKKGTATKWQKKFVGPLIIMSQPSIHTVKTKHLFTGKISKNPSSILFLKPLNPKFTKDFIERYTADGFITVSNTETFV